VRFHLRHVRAGAFRVRASNGAAAFHPHLLAYVRFCATFQPLILTMLWLCVLL
jgi:hypothetical protein